MPVLEAVFYVDGMEVRRATTECMSPYQARAKAARMLKTHCADIAGPIRIDLVRPDTGDVVATRPAGRPQFAGTAAGGRLYDEYKAVLRSR